MGLHLRMWIFEVNKVSSQLQRLAMYTYHAADRLKLFQKMCFHVQKDVPKCFHV